MALDAVVFPQDLFGYTMKELCSLGGAWGYDFNGMGEIEEKKGGILLGSEMGGEEGAWNPNWDSSRPLSAQNFNHWDANSSPPEASFFLESAAADSEAAPLPTAARRKRQRTKKYKNKEEVENQRMTHIAVERNRRKQMNEYLAVLRSIMPPSYVQRGDQASIIGGAINFVKELEQLLQSLEAQKLLDHRSETATPFADFFTFPQYSSRPAHDSSAAASSGGAGESTAAENRSAVADIEVTMVESHASLKVLSRRRPKQLLKMVVGLQNLRLTTLHLNVTTVDPMVLYSFSLKVEEGCELTSVDEIAAAVHRMIGKIEHDAAAADLVVD